MMLDRLNEFNAYAAEHGMPGSMAEFALWNQMRELDEQVRAADVRIASARSDERDRCVRVVEMFVGTESIVDALRKGIVK